MCDMHNSREYRWTAPGYTSPLDHFIVTLRMCVYCKYDRQLLYGIHTDIRDGVW